MIERHITFHVNPGKGSAFEKLFTELELLREAEKPDIFQMVFRWETAEAAAGWRNSEVHQSLQPALNALHSGMEIVVYEFVA